MFHEQQDPIKKSSVRKSRYVVYREPRRFAIGKVQSHGTHGEGSGCFWHIRRIVFECLLVLMQEGLMRLWKLHDLVLIYCLPKSLALRVFFGAQSNCCLHMAIDKSTTLAENQQCFPEPHT